MPIRYVIPNVVNIGAAKFLKNNKLDQINGFKEAKKVLITKFEQDRELTLFDLDSLYGLESEIIDSFDEFIELINQIQDKPELSSLTKENIVLPEFEDIGNGDYDFKKKSNLMKVILYASHPILAGMLLAYDFMETNKQFNKVREEYNDTLESLEKSCKFMDEIRNIVVRYQLQLSKVAICYFKQLLLLQKMMINKNKVDWNSFTIEEKLIVENTVLLVSLLHSMCKIQLVNEENDKINYDDISKLSNKSEKILEDINN